MNVMIFNRSFDIAVNWSKIFNAAIQFGNCGIYSKRFPERHCVCVCSNFVNKSYCQKATCLIRMQFHSKYESKLNFVNMSVCWWCICAKFLCTSKRAHFYHSRTTIFQTTFKLKILESISHLISPVYSRYAKRWYPTVIIPLVNVRICMFQLKVGRSGWIGVCAALNYEKSTTKPSKSDTNQQSHRLFLSPPLSISLSLSLSFSHLLAAFCRLWFHSSLI